MCAARAENNPITPEDRALVTQRDLAHYLSIDEVALIRMVRSDPTCT